MKTVKYYVIIGDGSPFAMETFDTKGEADNWLTAAGVRIGEGGMVISNGDQDVPIVIFKGHIITGVKTKVSMV